MVYLGTRYLSEGDTRVQHARLAAQYDFQKALTSPEEGNVKMAKRIARENDFSPGLIQSLMDDSLSRLLADVGNPDRAHINRILEYSNAVNEQIDQSNPIFNAVRE